ncbi:MAG: alpha-amylase family glycosyl hydrolase [Ruminococcus sp.]|nr:alpha-amylase family glycosyl hydrolase [Ruminococcus sp.]MDD5890561.1 alpha-amylase family glycosyl hydrolase [Ruminococcus sp.]
MKKLVAILMVLTLAMSALVVSASAAQTDKDSTGATGITVHYYTEKGTPSVYYWNALPNNISTEYPGVKMTSEGNNYYRYTFSSVSKINLQFIESDGTQGKELTRNTNSGTNEFWYKGNRWYNKQPSDTDYERTDLREDSIYFVITTRFYDGDESNNVHCWDDSQANNPDTDPAWRGDFKGLIQKLDYIKALGFSAIWITPVVENASGYDYHGYHAFDFTKVDPRYESDDTSYQDLIDAAHEKGLKIIQDVVFNHSGNFGEATLAPMFTKDYSKLDTADCMQPIDGSTFQSKYPNYDDLLPADQYQARLAIMKEDSNDTNHYYHHDKSLSYGSYTEQTGQMAGDCVDINTENPTVAKYITDAYSKYLDMGVDAFRMDTEKHINRWTLNNAYFPVFNQYKNFHLFGEVCARYHGAYNEGGSSDSCFFYTWKETESAWQNNWSNSDWKSNYDNSVKHFQAHQNRSFDQTSDNVYLNGLSYHTPDYSKANGTSTIDFPMHWAFKDASSAFGAAKSEDSLYNDATWAVTYVDSHDYGPDGQEKTRYQGGASAWAENMDLMFTFRGIPCIYYGSEIEFKKDVPIDVGPNAPLDKTGRAYFGDHLEGSVTASDYGKYTASGTVASTLDAPLSKHLEKLNQIRRAVPALQKGQYTTDSNYVSGNMAYIRRYTNSNEGVDSLACVTISGDATFKGLPNGTYIDAVTGDKKVVTGGTLSTSGVSGKGNMRVYVLQNSGSEVNGAIGDTGLTYLK